MDTLKVHAHNVRLSLLPPLSLYVHIPWCMRKCPYCDFNSHELKQDLPETAYVECLLLDIEHALPLIWGRKIHSVFFGGGTPSLMSAGALDRLLSGIRARLRVESFSEITLEANPGTIESAKFTDYRNLGINRLSIGVQSFNPQHLKSLGRIHDDVQARQAIEIARSRFNNINLDLMYALPGQSLEDALCDVRTAIAFRPQHISAYHLTLEPNTLFHRFPPQLPDEDQSAEMQIAIEAELAASGYEHYETSAFARAGAECRHNLNYWSLGDYLGIGAGAHSKLSFSDRIVREVRVKQPRAYMEKVADALHIQERHEVTARELPFEFMLNALRLNHGVPIDLFEQRTGLPLNVIHRELHEAESRGLLVRDHLTMVPTELGRRFLNDLLQIFLFTEN